MAKNTQQNNQPTNAPSLAPTPDNPMPLADALTPVFPEFTVLPEFEFQARRSHNTFNMRKANADLDKLCEQVSALTSAVVQLRSLLVN